MKLGRTRPTPEAGFDLIPMIDVVLLLIVFFVMSAQFAQSVRMPLDLPGESGHGEAVARAQTLILDLDASGARFMVGEPMDAQMLRKTITSHARASAGDAAGIDLIVRADRACRAEHLNRLAMELAFLGVRQWKLATAGEAGGGPP